MALLQMQRIYIYALNKDRKKILDLLQRREVVEVRSMLKEDSVFRRTEESLSVQDFEKNIAIAGEALTILDTYEKEDKSLLSALKGRKELPLRYLIALVKNTILYLTRLNV